MENAFAAANFIVGLEVGLVLDPIGTIGSLAVGYGTQKILTAAGVDQELAGSFGQLASQAFSVGRLGIAARANPVGAAVSLGAATAADVGLRLAGADPQASSLVGGAIGGVVGKRVSSWLMGRAPSVGDILREQRMARWEAGAQRFTAAGTEWEMSRGLRISEDVTLFRSMTPQAAAARPAGGAPGVVYALPPGQAPPLALPPGASVPGSGGVSPIPGVHYFPPGGPAVVPYEMTGIAPMFRGDAFQTGGFQPRSRLLAYASNGDGFTGGKLPAKLPDVPETGMFHVSPQQFKTGMQQVESWANQFLDTSVVRGRPLRESRNRALNSNWDPAVVRLHHRVVAETAIGLYENGDLPDELIPSYDAILAYLNMGVWGEYR
jgi:hypothetical protein